MKTFFNNLYQVSRVIIIIVPFIVLGWLIKKDLALSGHLEFNYDFNQDSPVITNLFPANRLTQVNFDQTSKQHWQTVIQEPVYFEARLPQKFDTARVEVVYQNQNQPLIQMGLRTLGNDEWNYNFKPLENQLLDKLDWFKLTDEQGTIWQKKKNFLTREQFTAAVPSLNNLAAYDYALPRKFFLPNYRPSNEERVITKALRGSHSFYTYLKNETLDFTFIIQDINRTLGPDMFVVEVYNEANKKVYDAKLKDDGTVNNFDGSTPRRDLAVKVAGLPEGVYRLELKAEDDIFIRTIRTKQQYVTFINRLYLVDNPEYSDGFLDLTYQPTAIYSNIPRLGFYTSHPQGLQTVGINKDQSVELIATHQNYFITANSLPAIVYSPKNDLKIFGRGLMAFSQDMFFNPEIYSLRDLTLTPDIEYIISSYQTPAPLEHGWKKGQVTFSLQNAQIVNRKLRFGLSAPEMNTAHDLIPIQSIKIIFDRQPMSYSELFQKIIKYIKDRI
ncbi:MAG: hypothetical protein Q8P32_01725 [Candidatus Komeilibacteria bacterium]|nr:hypothetical protein [Candidatus Komeilibacteria bacterium]